MEEYKKMLYATLFILIGVIGVGMAIIMFIGKDFELLFVAMMLVTIGVYGCLNHFSIDLPFLKINVDDKMEDKDE